jgi:transmembrane sensor
MDNNRFQELLLKYSHDQLSPEEWDELQKLAADPANEQLLGEDYAARLAAADVHHTWSQQKEDKLLAQLHERMNPGSNAAKIISWKRWVAAAAILAGVVTGSYFYSHIAGSHTPDTLSSAATSPGKEHAVLTLANGQQINLDTSTNGVIAQHGGITVINMKGTLSFNNQGGPAETGYNTIETGKGNQYQLILPDGSKVRLNAASSLQFPVSFTGTQRKVTLSGEGYFDIAPNAEKTFVVAIPHVEIQVLGTEFNVMAYGDEPAAKATLVKGSILLASGSQKTLLQPGKEGTIHTAGITVNDVDVEQAIAWKNGMISFVDAPLDAVMRQIARWYDVEISFRGTAPEKRFFGLLDRNVPLSVILEYLEGQGIQSSVQGRHVVLSSSHL